MKPFQILVFLFAALATIHTNADEFVQRPRIVKIDDSELRYLSIVESNIIKKTSSHYVSLGYMTDAHAPNGSMTFEDEQRFVTLFSLPNLLNSSYEMETKNGSLIVRDSSTMKVVLRVILESFEKLIPVSEGKD